MPKEKHTSMPTAVEAAAPMSTSTTKQPPPFTEEERKFITAMYFNYFVHEKTLETVLSEEHRLVLMSGELKFTPPRTEPEIRDELRRLCEDFRRPNREPRPWDIFLCPPQEDNFEKADFINQLDHYSTVFDMTYNQHNQARRNYCNDGLRALHEDPQKLGMAKDKLSKNFYESLLESLDDVEANVSRGWPHRKERADVVARFGVSRKDD
ncbi:MAG: hypothetical protein Q9206_003417 [Seirophora lacunosa]